MKNAFILDADVLLQCWDDAIQLAKERGKSEGEDFGEELFAVARRKGLIDKIKCFQTEIERRYRNRIDRF